MSKVVFLLFVFTALLGICSPNPILLEHTTKRAMRTWTRDRVRLPFIVVPRKEQAPQPAPDDDDVLPPSDREIAASVPTNAPTTGETTDPQTVPSSGFTNPDGETQQPTVQVPNDGVTERLMAEIQNQAGFNAPPGSYYAVPEKPAVENNYTDSSTTQEPTTTPQPTSTVLPTFPIQRILPRLEELFSQEAESFQTEMKEEQKEEKLEETRLQNILQSRLQGEGTQATASVSPTETSRSVPETTSTTSTTAVTDQQNIPTATPERLVPKFTSRAKTGRSRPYSSYRGPVKNYFRIPDSPGAEVEFFVRAESNRAPIHFRRLSTTEVSKPTTTTKQTAAGKVTTNTETTSRRPWVDMLGNPLDGSRVSNDVNVLSGLLQHVQPPKFDSLH